MADESATLAADMVEGESVQAALSLVMSDVQAISKSSRNTQQNFNFRGIDAVMNAVGPAFRRQGVVCTPISVELVTDERYQSKSGAQMRNVVLRIVWRFTGPDGSYMDAESMGEAADSGDKAISKAHSVAYRTVLLQALCIPTDDPDPDASSHERAVPQRQEGPPPPAVPRDWPAIESMIRGADNPEEAWALFQAFLRAASYYLFGETDVAKIKGAKASTLRQKAATVALELVEHTEYDGPFTFYEEDAMRAAWAKVLDGTALEIPDYVPPAAPDPADEAEALDEEAARMAAEAFAESEKNEAS